MAMLRQQSYPGEALSTRPTASTSIGMRQQRSGVIHYEGPLARRLYRHRRGLSVHGQSKCKGTKISRIVEFPLHLAGSGSPSPIVRMYKSALARSPNVVISRANWPAASEERRQSLLRRRSKADCTPSLRWRCRRLLREDGRSGGRRLACRNGS